MNLEQCATILDDTIVLTFTDRNFMPIFNIFYNHFEKHSLDNLLVVTLDKYSYESVSKFGIRTILIEYDLSDKYLFWKFRLDVINQIFQYSKKNILHTDADCFWFKNILTELRSESTLSYDLIGHVAYGHPIQIVEKIGFVMCCGLYYLKYNYKNRTFIDRIMSQDISYVDDQVYFNAFIYYNHKTISDKVDSPIMMKDIVLKDGTKVGILKDALISRTFHPDLYCFHPNLEDKIISNKLTELKKYIGEFIDYFGPFY
uniref:Nucleotide-diphospho-sugar transferase domain-containing protein n=1 Tax=viral metagenome TaxID=1070528 RepID=A0A6C0JG03_9ZZZZ